MEGEHLYQLLKLIPYRKRKEMIMVGNNAKELGNWQQMIERLEQRIRDLRNEEENPKNRRRMERLQARIEEVRNRQGLPASSLPVIQRQEIRNQSAFEAFGCDVYDLSPETPDKLPPDRELFLEFFGNFDLVPLEMPDGRKIDFWGFHQEGGEAQFPSDTLRVVEGEIVHAQLHVGKNVHTIHWHSIEPTTFNDGVGHTSFEVQSRYTYQWLASTAGTYLYHCHVNTTLHFEMGMYGFLIVDAPKPEGLEGPQPPYPTGGPGFVRKQNEIIPYQVEALWAVDEVDSTWHDLNHHIGISCPFMPHGPLNNFNPDFFAITGVFSDGVNPITDPRVAVTANAGDTVLIRLMNAGYNVHEYLFEGVDAEVIAVDGRTLGRSPYQKYSSPFIIPAGTPFRLTTARHWDLLLTPSASGMFQVRYFDWVTGKHYHTARTVINVS
jgi:plastocyanin